MMHPFCEVLPPAVRPHRRFTTVPHSLQPTNSSAAACPAFSVRGSRRQSRRRLRRHHRHRPPAAGYWNLLGGAGSLRGLRLLPPAEGDALAESIEYGLSHALSPADASNAYRRLYLARGPCELLLAAAGRWALERCSLRMPGGCELARFEFKPNLSVSICLLSGGFFC